MIRKGSRVTLELHNGLELEPPRSYAMLHDPSGKEWPARSVLVGPFKTGGAANDPPSEARDYLGRSYKIHEGSCDLSGLPRRVGAWQKLGTIDRIVYYRHGTKARGTFQHKFGKASIVSFFKGRGKATLYAHGDWFRIEMPKGAIADDRGIVWP